MPRIVTAVNALDNLRLLHASPVALGPSRTGGEEAALPSSLVVLKWGDNETPDGVVKVGAVTLRSLAANQKALNFDRIALDFGHNSVEGSATYQGEPCEVAAYGVPSIEEGVGIKLCSLEWTEAGKKFVGGGHYRDLSPAIKVDPASGEAIFIHSAAVCRQGAVTGLILNSAHAAHQKPTPKIMDPKSLLLAILGLAATATDAEIQAAAEKFGKEEKTEPAHADAGGEEVKALTATVKELGGALLALSSRMDGEARAGLLATATAEGKVVPVSLQTLGLAELKTLCASLPVTVPVKRETPELVLLSSDATTVIDPVQKSINAAMGISDAMFAKHTAEAEKLKF